MFVYIIGVPEEETFRELLLEDEGPMLKTNSPESCYSGTKSRDAKAIFESFNFLKA